MLDFLPHKDNLLLAWTNNFDERISVNFALYGLSSVQATEFHTLALDWSTRLATAQDPTTRNKGTIQAKNLSRSAIKSRARLLARIVNAFPGTTNQYRADLGLNLRDVEPTPIPPPATRPILSFDTSGPKVCSIRVVDELTPSSRKRLEGMVGCEIWGKIGDAAPAGLSECKYMGMATRNKTVLYFQDGDGGKRCHLIGRWINHRGETGPESNVVSATIAA